MLRFLCAELDVLLELFPFIPATYMPRFRKKHRVHINELELAGKLFTIRIHGRRSVHTRAIIIPSSGIGLHRREPFMLCRDGMYKWSFMKGHTIRLVHRIDCEFPIQDFMELHG
jgi:hypothetical protein